MTLTNSSSKTVPGSHSRTSGTRISVFCRRGYCRRASISFANAPFSNRWSTKSWVPGGPTQQAHLSVANPCGQQEVGEIDDVVVVEVGEKDRVHHRRIDVRLDHGARGVGATIKQVVPTPNGQKNSGTSAVRIRGGGAGSKHSNAQNVYSYLLVG